MFESIPEVLSPETYEWIGRAVVLLVLGVVLWLGGKKSVAWTRWGQARDAAMQAGQSTTRDVADRSSAPK